MNFFYFCKDGETVEGPIPADDLWRMVASQQLEPTILVSPANASNEWILFHDLPDTAFTADVLPKATSSNSCEPPSQPTVGNSEFMKQYGCLLWVLLIAALSILFLASEPSTEQKQLEIQELRQSMETEKRAQNWLSDPENRDAYNKIMRDQRNQR